MNKLISYINENISISDAWFECFGTTVPESKFECVCPEHIHVSHTPSAKIFGNHYKCFGFCQKVFGVYDLYKWYRPDRIEEIKRTIILPELQQKNDSQLKLVKRGDLSVKQYLDIICEVNAV